MKDEVMKDVAGESGHPSAGSQESAPIDNIAPQQVPSPEPHTMVSGVRRRGRRKIMKKKTLKDDEGYLGSYTLRLDRYVLRSKFTAIQYIVKKEEPAWESFSEDEPVAPKDRAPASTAPLSGKGKKTGGKPGQGNIMSFFSKK